MTMTPEAKARAVLPWTIAETVARIPPALLDGDLWTWDEDAIELVADTDWGTFRLHIALIVAGRRRQRQAVLSVSDDNGSVTWEADIPRDVWADLTGGAA